MSAPTSRESILRVDKITKNFGALAVLKELSFEVGAGELVSLVGPSGCGKTTLLRIIAGFEHADQGTISLGNTVLDSIPPERRPINTVFQSYALFPHLSVFENVAFGLVSQKKRKSEIQEKVGAILEVTRTSDLAKRRPDTLSGGQKQRVALARALVNEPALLLLDEPLSAIDAALRRELQMELRALKDATQTSFILVTHDQDEALAVSDRVLILNQGRIEQGGAPDALYSAPETTFVAHFLGCRNLVEATFEGGLWTTPFGRLNAPAPVAEAPHMLGIYAEEVLFLDQTGAENSFDGRVESRLFRGDHVELLVRAHERAVHVSAPIRSAPRIGETVHLQFPRASLKVLRA